MSAALHVAALTGAIVVVSRTPPALPEVRAAVQPAKAAEIPRLVFVAAPGPGGGGGGGGNRQSAPVRRAEAPGHDQLTLQVRRQIVVAPQLPAVPQPIAPIVLDARPLASGIVLQAGLPTGGVPGGTSLGPGTGGGVGEGTGTGIGSGTGPGIGPGSGGGIGGGVYRVGGGVSAPRLLHQVRPSYTSDALARKIQGTVELEAVVTRDGLATQVRVRQSLDPGLDNEAVKAVLQWRFTPGRLGDTPVDVWITVFLDFTIR